MSASNSPPNPPANTTNTSVTKPTGKPKSSNINPARLKQLVLDFLESKPSSDAYWCPTEIANKLKIKRGTVGWALSELLDANRVFWIPKGKVHLYASTKQYSDDFNRLIKIHPPLEHYEIHGLTLKLTAESLGMKTFGHPDLQKEALIKFGWDGVGGKGTGETSFQFSQETLMVWGGFTNLSLDYDRFMLWLARVDGSLATKGWPRIEGKFKHWIVCQFGLNVDHKRFRADKLVKAFTLQVFGNWFARCYEKTLPSGEKVLRQEIHSNHDEKTLMDVVSAMNGDMATAQSNNLMRTIADAQNNNTIQIQEMAKQIGKLKDVVSKNGGSNDGDLALAISNMSKAFISVANQMQTQTRMVVEKLEDLDRKVSAVTEPKGFDAVNESNSAEQKASFNPRLYF